MTPADLRAWQKTMKYTNEAASDALGLSVSGYKKLIAGKSPIDRRTALACDAVSAGLDGWKALNQKTTF